MKNRHPNRTVQIGFLTNSLIAIVSLVTINTEIALDIQFHDTYFVAGIFDLLAFIFQFFFLYFLFYLILKLTNRKVNYRLASIHYSLTTFIALCLSIFLIATTNIDFPKRYFSSEEYQPLLSDFHSLFIPLFLIYIFIQISFFIYFIFTIRKIELE